MSSLVLAVALALLTSCSPAGEQRPSSSPLTDLVEGVEQAPEPSGDAGPDGDALPAEEPAAPAPEPQRPAAPAEPPLHIDAEEYEGATLSIEDPDGAMAHFYGRLEEVARERSGALARISVFSDSINGADFVTSAIRQALQKRFGDGGKGFLPISPGWPTQHHQDVVWEHHRAWLTEVVNRGNGPGHRYGLGGVMSYNRTRHSKASFATVAEGPAGTAVSSYRLFYQAWPRGGSVRLRVDEGEPVVIDTGSDVVEDRTKALTVRDGPHRLEVSVAEGQLRLYGVTMEREGPGVVVDGLMLIGARGRRLALFDGPHLARQVALRGTDLLVFWMGGNDAESDYFDREGFLADYGAGVRNARAGNPDVSCLLVSIPDLGQSPGGKTRRRVPEIVEAQRELARAQRCAFFNYFEAMGGAGSARRWYRSSPRRLSADYIHPTVAGAEVMGQLFYKTLLRGFAEHLSPPTPSGDEEG